MLHSTNVALRRPQGPRLLPDSSRRDSRLLSARVGRRGLMATAQKGKPARVAPSRGTAPPRRKAWWLPFLIALVTAYAFAPAVHNGFTDWDDPAYVLDQHLIRDASLPGLKAIFTTYV